METHSTLQIGRERLIAWLQDQFNILNIQGIIVFDGSHKMDEESGLSYYSPLEIAYTPKGQSADAYIVENLNLFKNPKLATVVTNDQGLRRHAQALGAKTESNDHFLKTLYNRAKKREPKQKVIKESDYQMKRLQKIFEDKLEQETKEDDKF